MTTPPNNLEKRIQLLEDRAKITQLRAHYCHVLDDRNWEELSSLFTEDGEFQGLAHVVGRAGIFRFFSETVSNIAEGFWHFCTNPTLHIEGAQATGRISMQYLSLKDGRSYVSAGHYDDTLQRINGEWKFKKRKITFYYYSTLDKGFVGQPTYIHVDGTPITENVE